MDMPSDEDLVRMRDETVGNVDFDVTDEQLRQVWRDDPHLVALAREWTWGDTEARDQLCARLEALGAQPLTPGQQATVGLRVDIASGPVRRGETLARPADAVAGELTDLVENAILRSDNVRAAGAAVVVSFVGRPDELPPFADIAVILRVDVTMAESRWPTTTTTPSTLSEKVRAYIAAELDALEQTAGARFTVNVVSLVYGFDPDDPARSIP